MTRATAFSIAAIASACSDHPSMTSNACTADAQGVSGTALSVDEVDEAPASNAYCATKLLRSAAEVDTAFPMNSAPLAIHSVDFSVDRVVTGSVNPTLVFAVDSGTEIIVGVKPSMTCTVPAVQCAAYILHGTTRDSLTALTCPFTGAEPCP
jgi:hypothetical protein